MLDDDIAAHILDYFRSGAAKEDMMTNNKNLKTYRVTINLPPEHQTGDETKVLQAASVIDAKTAFVLAYYGHPFTAQFKLIRAVEIKEQPYEYTPAPWSDEMQEQYEAERAWGARWNDELKAWVRSAQ